jgi:hypothetical protein
MLKFNERLELPVIQAEPAAPAAKPKRKAKAKAAPAAKAEPQPEPQPTDVTAWATFGVVFTLVLSAALNGYANAQHAPLAFAGWLMGIAVPVLVLVLSKVAGEMYARGQRGVALFAGGSGVSLLALSVWHCAESIALLTGSHVALAVPMAVAIDAGLVACEVALLTLCR